MAPAATSIIAWRPPVAGVEQVLHARLVDFAYPLHCHDSWTVLLVDRGQVRYQLDRQRREAGPATVNLLPPGVVNDGRPGPAGLVKRVVYVDDRWLPASLTGRAVDAGPVADPELVGRLGAAHAHLQAHDTVGAEAELALALERAAGVLARCPTAPAGPEAGTARRLRRLLDEAPLTEVTLAGAAADLDRSVPHLVRSFRAAYGIPPHAYVTARRIDEARRRLLDGAPPARVAAEVGFHDQAHLTRHFRRHTGTTPAAWAARR